MQYLNFSETVAENNEGLKFWYFVCLTTRSKDIHENKSFECRFHVYIPEKKNSSKLKEKKIFFFNKLYKLMFCDDSLFKLLVYL